MRTPAFRKGSPKPVQFGDSALKFIWPFSLVQNTRVRLVQNTRVRFVQTREFVSCKHESSSRAKHEVFRFLTSSRSHFWILVFDIHLTFACPAIACSQTAGRRRRKLWHLKLIIQYVQVAAPFWDQMKVTSFGHGFFMLAGRNRVRESMVSSQRKL